MTIRVELRAGVAHVALDRPQVHNAFDDELIAALTARLHALDRDDAVRAVVLRGEGRSFCAGADLAWMRRSASYGEAENLDDARRLAALLATLAGMAKPTVARVHGNVFGGGVGLCACCDIAIAAADARFALSEVRLGLIPATIGPYVVDAIGARQARRYFLTGERFDAAGALRSGLGPDVVPGADLDARIDTLVGALLEAGPQAQAEAKALVRRVSRGPIDADMIEATARHIAAVRASPEGREGLAAFLERRRPAWWPAGETPGEGRKPQGGD
jgi:methylglutaconyl-CoA hydratase